MSRFTVLLPTYNRDYLIKNAIQSILDQTFKDYELLIIDDGSMDMTRKIISEIPDKRIKYIKLKIHQGLVPALQVGNEIANGEIIIKQDSDDYSLPNRLAVIDREMKDNDFFYHGMYQTWEEDEITMRAYLPALPIEKKKILKEQYIPGCFAYTKKFIHEIPYRQLYCSEDWMLILDAYFKKKKIGFINEGLYEYILRDDSNSMIHEGTGHYEADEKTMQKILKDEYGIKNFKYAERR